MKWPPPRFTPQAWADLVGWAVFVWIIAGVAAITILMVIGQVGIGGGGIR